MVIIPNDPFSTNDPSSNRESFPSTSESSPVSLSINLPTSTKSEQIGHLPLGGKEVVVLKDNRISRFFRDNVPNIKEKLLNIKNKLLNIKKNVPEENAVPKRPPPPTTKPPGIGSVPSTKDLKRKESESSLQRTSELEPLTKKEQELRAKQKKFEEQQAKLKNEIRQRALSNPEGDKPPPSAASAQPRNATAENRAKEGEKAQALKEKLTKEEGTRIAEEARMKASS